MHPSLRANPHTFQSKAGKYKNVTKCYFHLKFQVMFLLTPIFVAVVVSRQTPVLDMEIQDKNPKNLQRIKLQDFLIIQYYLKLAHQIPYT